MRQATEQWLEDHELWTDNSVVVVPNWLIMKPTSQQFVETAVWKAGMIQMLATLFGATTMLVVEDEQANTDELSKYASTFGMLYMAKSLAEAVVLISK
jgi:energy-converting hydrogenase Eha subunit H